MRKLLTMLFLMVFAMGTTFAQLSESFDAVTFPPTGWTQSSTSSLTWSQTATTVHPSGFAAHSGAGMARCNSWSVSSGTASLITPVQNFTSGAKKVSVWVYRDGTSYLSTADKLDVYVNTSASTTGATLLGTVNRSINLAPAVATAGWYQYTYVVPASFNTATNYVIFAGTSAFGDDIYIDDVYVGPLLVPGVATYSSPANGAVGVLTTASLNWTAPTTGDPLTGYKMYIGTNNPPTNLVNGTNIGNVLTYSPAGLATSTTYYWKVVPTNAAGDATGAPVWSFTTFAGFGSLQGFVLNSASQPVSGAAVQATGPSTQNTTSAANGLYQWLSIGAGTYTLGAGAPGYNTTTLPGVVVASGSTTNQDIVLNAPTMNIAPNPNNVTVSPNEVLDNAFTITNLGTGTLTWTAAIGNWSSTNHSWFSMPVTTGTVTPGNIATVSAIFNATGLPVGTLLSANVTFTSSPNVGTKVVPVQMVVAGTSLVPVTAVDATLTNQLTGATTVTWQCTPGAGFLYYKITRNGTQVGVSTSATTFNEVLPTFGSYTYCVSAVYTDGATAPVCDVVDWPNPTMTWSPATLAATVWSGHSTVPPLPLTLGNTGLGILTFSFPDYADNSGDNTLAYCAAASTACDEYIGNVQFGSINQSSGCTNYGNYTAASTTIVQGTTLGMTVTNGGNPYSSDQVFVWIDYDHNSTFDASELTTLTTNGGGSNFTGNITIPMSAMSGATTMRVRMSYATAANPCGSQSYGEVEDYTIVIQAPTFITAVAPATGSVAAGATKVINVTFSATGLFAPAGVYNNNLKVTSNDLAHASVNIPCVMTVIVPGKFVGIVTDGITGAPLPGVTVTAGTWTATTNDDGAYELYVNPGSYPLTFTLTGYQTVTTASQTVAANGTVTVNAQMFEMPYAPGCASAAVDANDTQSTVTWCVPNGPYELLYDDGSAENYAAWQMPGNMNAVKFTPKAYPANVIGGKFYVGDGSFPVGGNFMGKTFSAMVFKADGANGMPGTKLDSTGVTVNSYGWITVSGLNANITAGDFYLVMVQGSQSPNCVPIGVDESNPKAYKSYSRNVGTGAAWALSPYQDFMMHAIIKGAISSDDDALVVGKTLTPSKVAGMISMHAPSAVAGIEATTAEVTAPEGFDNSDVVSRYQLDRFVIADPNVAVNVAPNTTFVNISNTLTALTYVDGGTTWANLAQGWYAYGVKAIYPNGDKSAYVYTNLVPHKLYADVTVNVKLVCGFVPAVGSVVKFTGQDYPHNVYTQTVPASGTVFFDNMIMGKYDLSITKAGYYTYTQVVNITGNRTLNIVMEDRRYVPRNLFVDDRTLVATWDEPLALSFAEDFEGGVFPPAGWQATTQGSVGWYATTDGSSPYFTIPPHTTYAVANDDEGGSANNGCCDYLTTPNADLTLLGAFSLKFASFYNGDYGQMAYVEMSTDNGTTWTPIYTVDPSGAWTNLEVDLSAYSGASGLSNVKFAFHADDAGQWATGWAIDDVELSSGGVPLLGYGVFLDGTEVGQTPVTQRTWTYDPTTINYGQTYVAGVAGLYCSGYSDLDTYTFTAHFLYPPRNLQAEAVLSTTSGATYLTWEAPLVGDMFATGSTPRTSTPIATAEYSPMVTTYTGNPSDAVWDILLEFALPSAGHAGIETDGTYIYSTIWSGGGFSKFDLAGNFIEDFSIAGVNSIRDLAYNTVNHHFYGSNNSNTLYEMDFTNKVLIGSVTSAGTTIRHIAFNPALDGGNGGFYVGEWSSLRSIKMDGTQIASAAGFALTGAYGSAYNPSDNKLWIFDQGGNGVDLVEFDAPTMTATGNVHDASTDLTLFAGGIAGGLACTSLLSSTEYVMLGLVQDDHVFEYSMGGTIPPPVPNGLISYNLYRDDVVVANIPKTELEYWDMNLMPDHYCYDITAVYDLTTYGFPGQTDESLKEGTACVDVFFGYPLPFTEDWTTGQFDVNNWTAGNNWIIDGQGGNPLPSAKFKWDPLLTNYTSSLESFYLNGAAITTATPYKIWCDFDLKLDDRTSSTNEKLSVEVWNGSTWVKKDEYTNNGDFNWTPKHVDISSAAKHHVFKVRFNANGATSGDIMYWAVDNIHVWVEWLLNPPLNLTAKPNPGSNPKDDILVSWNPPAGGGVIKTYQLDDDSFENGWALNPGTEGWMGNQFSNADQGKIQSADVYFMANSSSVPLTIDIFDASQTIIASSASFVPPSDGWLTVTLPETDFAGDFYAMVHWNNTASASNWFGSDENGPQAANNLGWYYDGSAWAHLSDYGYAPNVFGIRVKALVDGDHPVVYGPAPASVNPPAVVLATPAGHAGPIMPNNNGGATATGGTDDLTGFKVYRNAYFVKPAAANTSGTSNFVEIASVPATQLTYVDQNLSNLVTNCYEYYVKAVYDEGLSIESNKDWECIFVGLNPADVNEISIYPNPATTYVKVDVTKDVKNVKVYNSLGSVVAEKEVSGESSFTISTSKFAAGVYSAKFTTSNGETFSRNFVVTK